MKAISLKPNGVGRYDDVSPFIIADNQLKLKIQLPNVNGEFYLVTDCGGNIQKIKLDKDGDAVIYGICAGQFIAQVKHYLKGELIKTYKIEPLLLKEVDGSISAEPEIIALTRENIALKEALAEERERAAKLEKTVEELKLSEELRDEWAKRVENKIKALCLFAFTDYRQNVYLDGGSLNDFAAKFGFEFTEEEIELLKEGNNEN